MSLGDGDYTLVAENGGQNSSGNEIDLEYEVKLVQGFPKTENAPFTGLPSLNPETSFQYNLAGKSSSPTMEIILYNDGTDRSNGSLDEMAEVASGLSYENFDDPRFSNGTVETIQEQEVWLTEYINNQAIPVFWRLYGGKYTDKVNPGEGTPIVITRIEPRPNPERPNEIRCTVRFNLGRRLI